MSSDAITFSTTDWIPPKLREIADEISAGKSPEPISVRHLLALFGAQRRGLLIVQQIRTALSILGIMTVPDFEYCWIDGFVHFVAPLSNTVFEPSSTASPALTVEAVPPSTGADESLTLIRGASGDPTHRIGKLSAANQKVLSVNLDDSIQFAVTLMLKNEYSQLPIMQSERVVKGIISWSSIGARMALGVVCDKVRDCSEAHHEVSSDESLFAVIPAIVQHGYVLVRAADNTVAGIVTASDLSLQFHQLAEPFLLLGEIEQHVRQLIEGKFTKAELEAARDPSDVERPIERVADLSLGECLRLLENPDQWGKLALKIDRVAFVAELDRVRRVRNDVMHFDPDPLGESDLHLLRSFVRFLRRLQEILPSAE